MINFLKNIKKQNKGVTLVEVVVIIFLIALFTLISISDFPKIMRGYALSRATYKLAQNIRSTQDLSLSGVMSKDASTYECEIPALGFGIYFDTDNPTQYLVYADTDGDHQYIEDSPIVTKCEDKIYYSDDCQSRLINASDPGDCVLYYVDLLEENSSLSIQQIQNGDDTQCFGCDSMSINFFPPNPTTNITTNVGSFSKAGIVLRNTDTLTRKVWVTATGLINVE